MFNIFNKNNRFVDNLMIREVKDYAVSPTSAISEKSDQSVNNFINCEPIKSLHLKHRFTFATICPAAYSIKNFLTKKSKTKWF